MVITGRGRSWRRGLRAALPGRVVPVVFGSGVLNALGWGLVGLVESRRLKDYAEDGAEETRLFWRQLEAVGYEVRPGRGSCCGGGWIMRGCTIIWC